MRFLAFISLFALMLISCTQKKDSNGEGVYGGKPLPEPPQGRQVIPETLLQRKELFTNKKFYQFKNSTCLDQNGVALPTYEMALEFTSDFQIKQHGSLCASDSKLAENLEQISVSTDGQVLGFGSDRILETNALVDETRSVPSQIQFLAAWCMGKSDSLNLRNAKKKYYNEARIRRVSETHYVLRYLLHYWNFAKQAESILDTGIDYPAVLSYENPFAVFKSLGFRWYAGVDPETGSEIWSVTDQIYQIDLTNPSPLKSGYPGSYTWFNYTTEESYGGDLRCFVTK